jgi:integrase/recombinase XerC
MDYIGQFLQYIQSEKRYSGHTVTSYKNDLEQFQVYMLAVYSSEEIESADFMQVRSWIVDMMDNGIQARSVTRKISTLKSFYKFLLKNNLIQANPMLRVKAPKSAKKLPVFLDQNKMNSLLDNMELFEETFEGQRNRLILEVFYATGMRLSELINIKVQDVDYINLTIKVLGKRNKERIIPVSRELAGLLKKYEQTYYQNHFKEEKKFLFLTEKGEKIYPKLVYNLVKSYLSHITTADKKSPHVLRHTFATNMLNNGSDINAIKEILGHANLSATQVYTPNSIEKLKNIYKQAHPKA